MLSPRSESTTKPTKEPSMARTIVIEIYAEAVPEKEDVDRLLPQLEEIIGSVTDGYMNVEIVDDRPDGT
jgi:hypothetical protein